MSIFGGSSMEERLAEFDAIYAEAKANPTPFVVPTGNRYGDWVAAGDPITHYVWKSKIPGGRPGQLIPPTAPEGMKRNVGYPVIVGGVYYQNYKAYQAVTLDGVHPRDIPGSGYDPDPVAWERDESGKIIGHTWKDPAVQATFELMADPVAFKADLRTRAPSDAHILPEGHWESVRDRELEQFETGWITHYIWRPTNEGVMPSGPPPPVGNQDLPIVVAGTWYESWRQFVSLGLVPGGGSISIGGIAISPMVLAGGAVAAWLLLRKKR